MNIVQCRMAKGALGWSTGQLSKVAGVPVMRIGRLQLDQQISDEDMIRMRQAFENAGVVFLDNDDEGPGVRLRKPRSPDLPKPVGPASDAMEAMDAAITEHRKSR